jgi:hypothetical protein
MSTDARAAPLWTYVKFPDSLRALLFSRRFISACAAVEDLLAKDDCCSREAVLPVLESWGVELDNMVVCLVADEIRARTMGAVPSEPPSYDSFFVADGSLSSSMPKLRDANPVLFADGGLIDTFLSNRVAALAQMIRRLRHDLSVGCLASVLGSGAALGVPRIMEICPTSSDSHCGGETVMLLKLTIDSGERCSATIVYKPGGADLGAALAAFAAELQKAGATSLSAMQIVEGALPVAGCELRRSYGWAAFVPRVACESLDVAFDFWRSAGSLFMCAFFCGLTDAHFENMIGCGRRLVLVDTETLFTPLAADSTSPETLLAYGERAWLVQLPRRQRHGLLRLYRGRVGGV